MSPPNTGLERTVMGPCPRGAVAIATCRSYTSAWDEAKRRDHFPYARPQRMKRVSTSRKSRTSLSRLRKMLDTDIVRDGDASEWTPEMFARAVARRGLKAVPKKALLSLRIDSDVIEWFKEQGAGYQSRMNALLRAYMEAHK
jgi:uncharacterized protein (DUF4415 family)